MPPWLEILLDFIGYAGFVAIATHAWPRAAKGEADQAGRDRI